MNLPKVYEAKDYEQDIYELWESTGVFKPSKKGDPFSIVLPPPNATGRLHVGHAAMLAIEDTIVRYQRMQGKSVLWVPGTDHAAIATQSVVEREIEKDGTDRHKMGRDKFLLRTQKFVDESVDTIRSQIRAMGASVDWSRERYTMEPSMNRIVGEVFVKMYKDGLIYRGKRIVNWDSVLQTTVSDDEVNHKEETTTFYTFKYGPFEIGTARPETKFGDKYVVVHPEDKRYAKYKDGETFETEWINGKIKATVIKDEAIDMEFGTGAMTITPWHDPVDFEIAQRHKLDSEQIIDLEGKLLPIAGDFAGMDINKARPKIADLLEQKGLLVKKEEDYTHKVGISDRGKAIVEPQIMEQWFIDVNKPAVEWKGKKHSLKQVMQSVVKDGDIDILPKRFDKTYFHWIDNLRDWCISRQIWWGHRIPAWSRDTKEGRETEVSVDKPEGEGWEQDPDTLDTWFSSSLWTWSTLIDPDLALNQKLDLAKMLKKSPDFQKYHPTTLMETGYDIIFFWVARMILMTTYNTGQIPFKTVYLHGLVRTKEGAKMSKSHPETIIDPLEVIPKYGTDALRLSMIVGQSPGNDMRIYDEKIASYRNFCNKLWNMARYVEGNVGEDYKNRGKAKPESSADHWILDRLAVTVQESGKLIDKYEIGRAYELIYHFIWDDFADWYIEVSKVHPNHPLLVHVLEVTLKITHPFAPFVTETIWETLSWEEAPLITSEWPKATRDDPKSASEFEHLRDIVKEIRYLQTQLQLHNNHLYYKESEFLDRHCELIIKFTGLVGCQKVVDGQGLHLTKTSEDCWIDVEESKAHDYLMKLVQIREEKRARIKSLEGRLKNKGYMRSAPKEVVNQTKEDLGIEKEQLGRIELEVDSFEHALKRT